jgi:hypothetical protein
VVRPGTDLSVQVSPRVRSHGGGTWGRNATDKECHAPPCQTRTYHARHG